MIGRLVAVFYARLAFGLLPVRLHGSAEVYMFTAVEFGIGQLGSISFGVMPWGIRPELLSAENRGVWQQSVEARIRINGRR